EEDDRADPEGQVEGDANRNPGAIKAAADPGTLERQHDKPECEKRGEAENEAARQTAETRRQPWFEQRVKHAPEPVPEHVVDRGGHTEGRHRLKSPDKLRHQIADVESGAERALEDHVRKG